MIPKRIFYVWGYGERKSRMAEICIENWRRMLPDYEVVEINEKSKEWFDFDYEYANNLWFKTVYDLKLWAYVADYMRVKTVHDHGGIYLDTDVTVYKTFDPLLTNSFFVGQSFPSLPEPSVFGSVAGHPVLKRMLGFYKQDIWHSPFYVITFILKQALTELYHLEMDKTKTIKNEDVTIYPMDYFQPFYYTDAFNPKCITDNTYTAHWQGNSWMVKKNLYFLSNKHRVPLATLLKQLAFIEKADKHANDKIELKMEEL